VHRVLKLAFAAATLLALALGITPVHAQQVTTLIQFTNVWKYDQSGLELGAAWRTNDYDDSAWVSGPGLLGFEDIVQPYAVHAPINTQLTVSSAVTTFYFRATFDFDGTTNGLRLIATNLVDDGCVIYLNGLRVGSVRAPAFYDANSFFPGGTEGQLEVVTLTNFSSLRQGLNLLAVEVHQSANTSADIVWGTRLMAVRDLPLSISDQPQSQTRIVGDTITLAVGVSGSPVFYRWEKDGVIQPSTSNSLRIANAQLTNAGNYRVIVTNSISAATSSVATLTVFADTTGPRLLAAFGNYSFGGGTPVGSNTIYVQFTEPLTITTVLDTNNYTVMRIGAASSVRVLRVQYNPALGALLTMDATDPDWTPGGDYFLTVNNVTDIRGNVIAPDSQVPVAWGQTTSLVAYDAVWDFHTSAIFEPEVFGEDWFACDYTPSSWWAQGQGIFLGGVLANISCLPPGTSWTPTGYQPEPALYRTTFLWPAHWPSSGTLRITAAIDDALVLYLDGREIYRTNAGTAGSMVGLATKAAGTLSVCLANLAIASTNLQPGAHCLAAAVLQADTPFEADSAFALRMDGLAYLSPALPEQPPPVLSLTLLGANSARLSWTGGGYALESATNLNLGSASYPLGPWQQVTNMSNPYTNNLSDPARFFRLKK